jgi:hypothetical protein
MFKPRNAGFLVTKLAEEYLHPLRGKAQKPRFRRKTPSAGRRHRSGT